MLNYYKMFCRFLGLVAVLSLLSPCWGLRIDPINSSCLLKTDFEIELIDSDNTSLHRFVLAPFSRTIIEIDLRHLVSIPLTAANQSVFQFIARIGESTDFNNSKEEEMGELETGSNKLSLYVSSQNYLWV